jgi:hypothetical protein
LETLVDSSIAFWEKAITRYQEDLTQSSEGLGYLAGRGIDENAAHTARLGLVSRPLPEHEGLFEGMLVIPYLTKSGPVGAKFRRLDGGDPKYTAPIGQQARLYNAVAALSNSDVIAVCEGELDTVVMHYSAGVPAVGVPGVSAWKPHYRRVLRGFSTVLVVADNDDKESGDNPGQELAARVIKDIPWARNVMLPKGYDVTEFYMAEGRDGLLRRVGIER